MGEWLRRLMFLFQRHRFDRELDEELRFHVDMSRERLEASGASAADADGQARRRLGPSLVIRDLARAPWTLRRLDELLQDLRYAVRVLWRRPGIGLCTIAVLALGIGTSTSMFSFLYGVLLRPLPYADASRIVVSRSEESAGVRLGPQSWSSPAVLAFFAGARAFDSLAAFTALSANLVVGGAPSHVWGMDVTPAFFEVLGVRPARGRTFQQATSADLESEAVISDRLWRDRFAGDPAIIGRALTVNGVPRTIVGVLPAGFVFRTATFALPEDPDVWLALRLDPNRHGLWYLRLIGRMREGVTVAQADADLSRVAQAEIWRYPHGNGVAATMVRLEDDVSRPVRLVLALLAAAVALLLLVACTNAAALFLMRAVGRDRELSLRLALGASRARVVRQLVTESVVLAALGGVVGVALAVVLTRLIVTFAPAASIPRLEAVVVDRPVVGFAVALTMAIGVLFGLLPAWQSTRTRRPSALAAGAPGRVTATRSTERWRMALVALQVASTVVLLIGALLLGRSLVRLVETDDGFSSRQVVTATVQLPESTSRETAVSVWRGLLDGLRQRPGMEGVSAINQVPLGSSFFITGDYTVEGRTRPNPPNAAKPKVGPGYFRALDIPLLRGRDFTARDDGAAPLVAIVSERFARLYFGEEDPTGSRLSLDVPGKPPWMTIVGVVGDVRQFGPSDVPVPAIYVPYAQEERAFFLHTVSLVVPTSLDPAAVANAVRDALRRIDPALPVQQVSTLARLRGQTMAEPRFRTFVLGVFAVAALTLAVAGLFAMVSHGVAQRWREIGVRVALGADGRRISALVARHALLPVVFGVVAGLGASLWLAGALAPFLFEVAPRDVGSMALAVALLLMSALAASAWPAWRAMHIDPTVALRIE